MYSKQTRLEHVFKICVELLQLDVNVIQKDVCISGPVIPKVGYCSSSR